MIITWDKQLETGFQLIDGQHRQFIDVLNRLSDAIQDNLSQEEINEIFIELNHYGATHFQTEEKLFEQYQFPLSQEHIALHNTFKSELSALKTKLSAGDLRSAFRLLDFLEDWFVNHITNEDRKYIDCFKNHGLE